jgi:hypothetical protein
VTRPAIPRLRCPCQGILVLVAGPHGGEKERRNLGERRSPAAGLRQRATRSTAAWQRPRYARPWHARRPGRYAAGSPGAGPGHDSLARERPGVASAGREEPLRPSATGCQATTESLMAAQAAAVAGRSRRRQLPAQAHSRRAPLSRGPLFPASASRDSPKFRACGMPGFRVWVLGSGVSDTGRASLAAEPLSRSTKPQPRSSAPRPEGRCCVPDRRRYSWHHLERFRSATWLRWAQ